MADRLQVNVKLDDALDRELEEYRRQQDRIPDRSAAVRDLLKQALACAKEKRQKE